MCATAYEKLQQASEYIIFGAQATAYGAYCAIKELFGKTPVCFLVTGADDNPESIEGIKVTGLSQAGAYRHCLVLIATPPQYLTEITRQLTDKGFRAILIMDSYLEYRLMGDFYTRTEQMLMLESVPVNKNVVPQIEIYMAKSNADCTLSHERTHLKHIISIHAGAALSSPIIADIADNTGDNISYKNRNYCELTATYWVWKNTSADYKGICHYRRVFNYDDTLSGRLSSVDALLPLPFWCYPTAGTQYGRYVSVQDFSLMMEVIGKTSPGYLDQAQRFFGNKILYNYNMVVARQHVFDSYCDFLFGILTEVEARNVHIPRSDRYLGYLGELLTSLYFCANKDKFKIAHAQKEWLI